MTNVFFDTKGGFSTYKKVLDQNEHESRKIRIAHAEEALQRLKQEIDRRMDKLNEILILSEERHALYDYKLAQYEAKTNSSFGN
ncbi:Uncharacterised protein [Legionella hackeliae]|uniref:hypothetical protein n=1 Tax=Legionella hackeliae TaxID=449 RepID=UPI000E11D004|nr:hypothetical protein [Legionella hackeliae]STX49794.1 Uncharacterised protein [Legionella hackeliae]